MKLDRVRAIPLCLPALLLWPQTLHSQPSIKQCVRQYMVEFEAEAGITYEDWAEACQKGEDPQSFYQARRQEHLRRTSVALVEEVLQAPVSQLSAEKVEAFLGVDPGLLPGHLQRPYAQKRQELQSLGTTPPDFSAILQQLTGTQAQPPAASSEPPGEKDGLKQFRPNNPNTRDPKFFVNMGWDELVEDENRWLLKTARCTEEQLEARYLYKVTWETRKWKGKKIRVVRWFIHPKDPLDALIARYRSEGPSATLRGTTFFGRGGGGLCQD